MAPSPTDQAASLRQQTGLSPRLQSKKAICCVAIASGKGGVGKTMISVNLAIAFAKLNKRVLLVDADLGLANTDIILGVHPAYTIQDAIFKGKRLDEVALPTKYGIDLMSASSGSKEMISLGAARMNMFINDLVSFASDYDVLLFDCAAGIDSNVTSFIAATPQSIIVVTPQPTSIMDVYALIKLIHQDDLSDNVGLIVNQAESEDQGLKVLQTLNRVTERYLGKNLELLGIVPISSNVKQAVHARQPIISLYEDDPVSRKIREISKTILQKQSGSTRLTDLDGQKLLNGLLRI